MCIKQFCYVVIKNRKPIFIDEVSIGSQVQSIYGYAQRGKNLLKSLKKSKNGKYTMVMAVSEHHIIGYMFYLAKKLTAQDFYFFLIKLINLHPELLDNYFLIMDIDKSHTKMNLYSQIESYVPLFFLSRYTPEFNLAELIFPKLKRELLKKNNSNWFALLTNVHQILQSISVNEINRYYRLIFQKMQLCFNEKEIREINHILPSN